MCCIKSVRMRDNFSKAIIQCAGSYRAAMKKVTSDYLISVGITFIIVIAALSVLYAYTGNWPPMVVVESGSMQHSASYAYFGDINTGDVVMVKKVSSASQIITYVQGEASGFRSYGEFGNVVIYRPLGDASLPLVIHRAIIYLQYNSTGGGFNVPSLALLPISQWAVLSPQGRVHYVNNVRYNIEIEDVGYTHTPVIIPVQQFVGTVHFSGFITMGDYNHAALGLNSTDQSLNICPVPVKFGWIRGIAQGYLPYLGLIKLFLSGKMPSSTPKNSIYSAIIIVGAIIAAPFAADEAVARIR